MFTISQTYDERTEGEITGDCSKDIICVHISVCTFTVCVCMYNMQRDVYWGKQSHSEYVAAFYQPQISYRNPLHCANMEVHT